MRAYWSLEDTFTGYLLNELNFCSSQSLNNFAFDSCPRSCVTSSNPFWNAASSNFAKRAFGEVIVVMNGTRSFGALSNTSTFYNYELKELSFPQVRQLKVYLVHVPGQTKYETCNEPKTLSTLKELAESKQINYLCEDNPENIIFSMCFMDASSNECQAVKAALTPKNSIAINQLSKFLIILTSILYFFILLL